MLGLTGHTNNARHAYLPINSVSKPKHPLGLALQSYKKIYNGTPFAKDIVISLLQL
jgi:hypothetical protein